MTADIPCITTVPGAAAAVMGIEALIRGEMAVRPLQELHAALRPQLNLPWRGGGDRRAEGAAAIIARGGVCGEAGA